MTIKVSHLIALLTAAVSFVLSYIFEIFMGNVEQYMGIISVVFVDGFFGVCAGIKREGFKTYKAIKILKTAFAWVIILSAILMVEKGFVGAGWLSETIIIPFMVFELISALKNASMSGFIKVEILNKILDKIDSHKGFRL